MFKIGDFSKISLTTIKALRLYDQMGLLKPAYVDDFTGYRYYSADQLPRLHRIVAFKDLGFSLEQIGKLLNENLDITEIRGMLRLKQGELQRLVEEEKTRLLRIEARIQQMEKENIMPTYEIILKKVEPVKVVSIRQIVSDFKAVPQIYDELFNYLNQHGVEVKDSNYCAGIWHETEYKESDFDWEAVASLDKEIPTTDKIKIYELPGMEMACAVHNGSYNTMNPAYTAIAKWIEANGYKIIGPSREVYIVGGNNQEDESYVTEVQFPVAKVNPNL
jgi:effector-binding domain-containing protein